MKFISFNPRSERKESLIVKEIVVEDTNLDQDRRETYQSLDRRNVNESSKLGYCLFPNGIGHESDKRVFLGEICV